MLWPVSHAVDNDSPDFSQGLAGFLLCEGARTVSSDSGTFTTLKAKTKSSFLLFGFFQPLHDESHERREHRLNGWFPYLIKVGRPHPGPFWVIKNPANGKLDGQASHGPSGERLYLLDRLQEPRFGLVGLEGELVLDGAGIIDHTHPRGVGAHVQPLDHPRHEDFDFLKLVWAHTSRAVDDEHQVGGFGSTQRPWKWQGVGRKVKETCTRRERMGWS